MKTQSTSTQPGTSTNVATEKINDKPKVKQIYIDRWFYNDFYADDSFHEERSLEEVKALLNSFIKTFADNGYQDWVEVYNNLLVELEEEFQKI